MPNRNQIVKQAQAWVGCNEADGSHRRILKIYNDHRPLARGYEVTPTDPWCATFISALAIKLGYTDIIPPECSCTRLIELFKAKGIWIEDDAYKPSPGDIVLYDWQDSGNGDNRGTPDHIGLVESVAEGVITIIEGNISNAVGRRNIPVNGRYIRGYGVPKYTETAPISKSIDDIAREVIAGKWGNGDERKKKLTAAGYSHPVVQARVNELLGYKTLDQLAQEVMDGKWGNGDERKKRLTAAGHDYTAIQKRVNELLKRG